VKRTGKKKRRFLLPVFTIGLSFYIFPTMVLGGWSDWWKTPEQRALKLYESGNHAALIESSPNDDWTALGQFENKEFSEASSSFAKSRETLKAADNSAAATTALYNQAVSDVLSGQYEQAIEHFDEVLSESPEFADAEYNRDIAQKLLDLQEKQESPQDQSGEQDQDGEEGEQGDQNSEQSDSDQSSESSDNEPSDSSNEEGSESENSSESDSESEQNNSSSAGEESEDGDSSDSASEEQQQQEEQQARDALAAEALQEQLEKGEDAGEMMEQAFEEQPLSESEQATEQILRRIPDDPRGLLRRKLEQSHRNEFPEVRDAIEPW